MYPEQIPVSWLQLGPPSRLVSKPTPTRRTLFGTIQVALSAIVYGGNKMVIGIAFGGFCRVIDDGNGLPLLLLQAMDPPCWAGIWRTPRASTTPPAGETARSCVIAWETIEQKSALPQLFVPPEPQKTLASTQADEAASVGFWPLRVHTALSPFWATTRTGAKENPQKTRLPRKNHRTTKVVDIFMNSLLL